MSWGGSPSGLPQWIHKCESVGAVHRVDVESPQVLAVHPQPNENAWLLGYATLHRHTRVGVRWKYWLVAVRLIKHPLFDPIDVPLLDG